MTDVTIIPNVTDITIVPSVTSPTVSPATSSTVIVPSVEDVFLSPSLVDAIISPIFGEQGPAGPQGPAGTSGSIGWYGSFYDTTTQLNSSTFNTMRFDTQAEANDVSIVDGTKITVVHTAVYNVQFSAQFDKTDAGTDVVDVWLAVNGTNLAWSDTKLSLVGNNAKMVAAWNFVLTMSAGQYCELRWASPDVDLRLYAEPEDLVVPHPAVPSVIVTITQVSNTVTNGGAGGYDHSQVSASATWTINHNLGYKPNVQPFNTGGAAVVGEIIHTSVNQTVIYFNTAIAGFARLA